MPDYIDPAVGIPLAVALWLTWWLVEHHAATTTKEK